MKCPLGISDFLEEFSSLSHSVVFLYFFALITEEGFLISFCYSLELCIQMGISFLFSFALASLPFTTICKASSDSHFAFLNFFSLGMVLIPVQCHEPPSIVHQALCLTDLTTSLCLHCYHSGKPGVLQYLPFFALLNSTYSQYNFF